MSESRPTEHVAKTTISATLPTDNPGNLDIPTGGAPCVFFECITATSTPVVKVYVKSDAGGTWRTWRSFQNPVDSDTRTLRAPDTSITLVAGDQIIVQCAGFYAVRLDLQSGTSAVLTARTADNVGDLIQTSSGGGSTVKLNAEFVDDTAYTPGSSSAVVMGAEADETSPDSVDEGDAGALRMTLDRRLRVETTNGALLQPKVDSYATVAINLTTGADQVLVSSAASKQIWVYAFGISVGDAAGQTISLQDEDNVALSGIMEFQQYGGIATSPSGNFSMPLFKLGTDKDLEIDITGGDADGFITYALISV